MRTARSVPLHPVGPRLAIGATALLIALWAAPARACKCAQLAPPQAFDQAVAVFEGRVVKVEEPAPEQTGPGNQRVVRLQAARSWKGVESESVELSTARDSAACGFGFVEGQSYLVYAYAEEGRLRVSSCSRTRLMSDAGEDIQAMGMGATPVEPTRAATSGSVKAPAKPSPTAPARGGCASCSMGSRPAPTATAVLGGGLALAALVLVRRKRRTGRTRLGPRESPQAGS